MDCSDSEKKIARRAFDTAFSTENSVILAALKRLALKAEKPADIGEKDLEGLSEDKLRSIKPWRH